ncbi:transglycosylase SLT domain-containing protein, partial [bacterium]|nr:transglycosylase SLT domain-containing protein [bacterium]
MDRFSLNPIPPIDGGEDLQLDGMRRAADSARKVMQWARESKVPDHVEDKELYRACQGFEAYFARELMKKMRGDTNMMGGKGPGTEIYQGMFDNAIGDHIAASGRLGLADMLYRQIHENEGVSPSYPNGNKMAPIDEEFKLDHWSKTIENIAHSEEVDPDLLRAMVAYASGGDPQHVDEQGGMGLTGLTPAAQKNLGVENPFDPDQNLQAAAGFLSERMEQS